MLDLFEDKKSLLISGLRKDLPTNQIGIDKVAVNC